MRKERGNGMKKMKLTKLEKFWVLYDVGNSAFIMLVSTIIPIYFNYLAGKEGISEVDYLAYWGYAASVATILVAFIGPVLGPLQIQKILKSLCLPLPCWWESLVV